MTIRKSKITKAPAQWVEKLRKGDRRRVARWTESLTVGEKGFVERVQRRLGIRAKNRLVKESGGSYPLKESVESYRTRFGPQKGHLSPNNGVHWADS